MNVWTLVACEPGKTDLACLLGFQYGLHAAAFGKNTLRIRITNHFVELEQVNAIGLQPPKRFIELGGRGSLGTTINLGHQKRLPAIAVAQGFAHSNFALSPVVVPAVIEKIDSLVDPRPNNPNALFRIALSSQVISTESNR